MKKILILLLPMLIGCAPTMFRNAETGATAECTYSGLTPLITKLQCISSLKNQGWVEITPEEISQAKTLQASLIAKAKICFDKIKTQPQLNIISSKLSLGGLDEQTFSMLTNTSKPTEEEKTAINVYADLRKNCIKEHIKTQDQDPLAARQLYASSTGAVENLLVDLYKGNLTYGQFAQLRKEIATITMAGLVEIDKELKSNAADANARAEQMAVQRSIAFANITNAEANKTAADALKMESQKIQIPALQRSSPNIHCTSQNFGGIVNTNCN
jgi:hypothetical protein